MFENIFHILGLDSFHSQAKCSFDHLRPFPSAPERKRRNYVQIKLLKGINRFYTKLTLAFANRHVASCWPLPGTWTIVVYPDRKGRSPWVGVGQSCQTLPKCIHQDQLPEDTTCTRCTGLQFEAYIICTFYLAASLMKAFPTSNDPCSFYP